MMENVVATVSSFLMGHPVIMTLDIAMLDHVPQEMTSAKTTMDHVCMGGGGSISTISCFD